MDMNITERFLKKAKGENTRNAYKSNIIPFLEFIKTTHNKDYQTDLELVLNVTTDDCEDYVESLQGKYKASTINLKITTVVQFFKYACSRSDVKSKTENPTLTLETIDTAQVKLETAEKYVPTIEEIKIMIKDTYIERKGARNQSYMNSRNRFMLALACTTGLRINELLGIKMSDIERVDGGYMIEVFASKNKMFKRVPICENIIQYYNEYMEQRDIFNTKYYSDLLFLSSKGKKIGSTDSNMILKAITERNGIKHISNHCFRHFLTQYLNDTGVDRGILYKVLGWRESGIDINYSGATNDKKYDLVKLQACNVDIRI